MERNKNPFHCILSVYTYNRIKMCAEGMLGKVLVKTSPQTGGGGTVNPLSATKEYTLYVYIYIFNRKRFINKLTLKNNLWLKHKNCNFSIPLNHYNIYIYRKG